MRNNIQRILMLCVARQNVRQKSKIGLIHFKIQVDVSVQYINTEKRTFNKLWFDVFFPLHLYLRRRLLFFLQFYFSFVGYCEQIIDDLPVNHSRCNISFSTQSQSAHCMPDMDVCSVYGCWAIFLLLFFIRFTQFCFFVANFKFYHKVYYV